MIPLGKGGFGSQKIRFVAYSEIWHSAEWDLFSQAWWLWVALELGQRLVLFKDCSKELLPLQMSL